MNGTEKKESFWRIFAKGSAEAVKKRAASLLSSLKETLKRTCTVKSLCKKETVENITTVLKCLGLLAVGFLFGICRLDYMTYPLGIAMLLASGRYSFFVYAGSAIAALTYPALGFAFFGVNTLIYIIRKILLSDDFSESRKSRIIMSFLTSVFICSALLLSSSSGIVFQNTDSDIFICCTVYMIGIPLSCFLLYPIAGSESFAGTHVRTSLCFFCMCLTLSAGALPFFAKTVSYFIACVCTLIFCTLFESHAGIPAGALFGISTLTFPLCAPLCISAFIFRRFYDKYKLLVYPFFFICCTVTGLFVLDRSSFSIFLPSCFAAVLIYMPIGVVIRRTVVQDAADAPSMREAVGEAYTKRMSDLSHAFGSVSKLCFGLSGRMRFPTSDDARLIVSMTASKACSSCSDFASCKKKQLWNSPAIDENLLSGKLTASVLPEKLAAECHNAVYTVNEINREYRRLLSERFNNNKTEILAYEYATLAKILKYTSKVSSDDVCFDGKLTKLALNATKKLGLTNTGVTVYGSRKKTLDISGVPVSCINIPSEKLASFYSAECGEIFESPEYILDENSTFTVRFTSKEAITTEYTKVSHTKNGETVNGDTVSFFKSDDSFFYALIADGMGSGRDAAMTSKLTSVFVEKLLSGGAGKGVTMELLNNLLMSKNKECFSSVDLLEIDLIRKRASFVKAGAAPTYLLRSTKLFKVSSDTPPCGIIEGFCAENTSFEIFPGDTIIMLSDGISSSMDCGSALCDIMNNAEGQSMDSIAGKILDMAVSMSVHDDDMSCVIIKIK